MDVCGWALTYGARVTKTQSELGLCRRCGLVPCNEGSELQCVQPCTTGIRASSATSGTWPGQLSVLGLHLHVAVRHALLLYGATLRPPSLDHP